MHRCKKARIDRFLRWTPESILSVGSTVLDSHKILAGG